MTKVNFIRLLAFSALFLAGLSERAWAHESRVVGGYRFVFGFRNEPAYVGEVNSAEITITRDSDAKPINKTAGDDVDLKIEVQLRQQETFDSAVVRSAPMTDGPKQAFGTDNRYGSWFRPTLVGTFAFHITGTVSDKSDPKVGPLTIDEFFVCGKGTRAASGAAFGCIQAPQEFPGVFWTAPTGLNQNR